MRCSKTRCSSAERLFHAASNSCSLAAVSYTHLDVYKRQLLANMWATFRRREDAEFFGRRIDGSAVKNAATIAGMYLTLFFLGAFVIAAAEQLPMSVCLYETASAVATVGLTLGITPQLGILSQGVLIALMFLGRVGGLTLIYAASVSYTHLISNILRTTAAASSSTYKVCLSSGLR